MCCQVRISSQRQEFFCIVLPFITLLICLFFKIVKLAGKTLGSCFFSRDCNQRCNKYLLFHGYLRKIIWTFLKVICWHTCHYSRFTLYSHHLFNLSSMSLKRQTGAAPLGDADVYAIYLQNVVNFTLIKFFKKDLLYLNFI